MRCADKVSNKGRSEWKLNGQAAIGLNGSIERECGFVVLKALEEFYIQVASLSCYGSHSTIDAIRAGDSAGELSARTSGSIRFQKQKEESDC